MGTSSPTLKPAQCLAEQTLNEWQSTFKTWNEPAYRAKQLYHWIHQHGVYEPEKMTNLSKSLREKLAQGGLKAPFVLKEEHVAEDGTRKLLLELNDGAVIETVLIPQYYREGDNDKKKAYTQCISTQVGCAMGCVFCASGVAGLKRNMRADEIEAQVILARIMVGEDATVRNLVYMGMGEPLHNYDALARSLVLLTSEEGQHFSSRRITVSTSGLVPELERLGKDFGGKIQLAVSLHAPESDLRSKLMPINRKYDLGKLIMGLRRYPMPQRSRITIEYTLMRDINDSLEQADALAKLLRNIPCKINLIPMNPISGSKLGPPEWPTVDAFQQRLQERHFSVFVRRRMGDDIAAACGQLALAGAKKKVRSLKLFEAP